METSLLNNELMITVPDGFHVMDDEELGRLNSFGEKPGWSIADPDRHITISIAWKKNAMASFLLNPREIAKKMEMSLQKIMAPYGYELQMFVQENLGGVEAPGFRYAYSVQETGMIGESLSMKKGKTFYYVHCYLRRELLEESIPVLQEIFESCRWTK
ncbi:MAG: hypothetical protein Q4D81_12885 [Eubacteriales bacterium]|nr:hypothetical protein [Eubacteriales bacterium]